LRAAEPLADVSQRYFGHGVSVLFRPSRESKFCRPLFALPSRG